MRQSVSWTLLALAFSTGLRASDWKYAAIPGFEIYTDVPEETSRQQLHDFLVAYRDFQAVWPTPLGKDTPQAVVIFCAEPAEYAALNPDLGLGSKVRPKILGDRPAVMANFNLPVSKPLHPYNVTSFSLRGLYVDSHLSKIGERVPPWLEQGLGKLLGGVCCTDDTIEFPAVVTDGTFAARERGADADLRKALREGSFLSLEALFSTVQTPKIERPGYAGLDGSQKAFWATLPHGLFVDEAYEFTQFCLFAEHGRYREAFIKFAQAASNGPMDEANFRACFGRDYAAMLQALWRDAGLGEDQFVTLGASTGEKLPPVPGPGFRPATAGEMERIKAEWAAGKGPRGWQVR